MPSQKKERRKATTTKCDMSVQVNLDEKRPTRHPQPRGKSDARGKGRARQREKGPNGESGRSPKLTSQNKCHTQNKPNNGGAKNLPPEKRHISKHSVTCHTSSSTDGSMSTETLTKSLNSSTRLHTSNTSSSPLEKSPANILVMSKTALLPRMSGQFIMWT